MSFLENCKHMLKDRRYIFVKDNEFGEIWQHEETNMFVLLITSISDSVQIRILEPITKDLKLIGITSAIKIFRDCASSCVHSKILKLGESGMNIELVHTNQLICNIMTHVFQPKYTKCSLAHAERAKALHLYALPQFVSEDPVVTWMGWKKGDVIMMCFDRCESLGLQCDSQYVSCCPNARFRIVV